MNNSLKEFLAQIAFKSFRKELRKLANTYFYENRPPSPQNAIDIFEGMWSSKFPNNSIFETKAQAKAFEDRRIKWAIEQFGDLNGKCGLELGPLEAGHSYMLQNAGIKSLLSIESNSNSYLKCLVVKEILSLNRVNFLFGDFVKFLNECDKFFDFVIASGVLYHMKKPIQFIESILNKSDYIYVWTHYYAEGLKSRFPEKFPEKTEIRYRNKVYQTSKYLYNESLEWDGFCGGPNNFSFWLEKNLILNIFKEHGFEINIHFDDTKHVHGPCISFIAHKK